MKYPFTTEQFFGVFEAYNTSVWPAQILLYLAATLIVVLVYARKRRSGLLVSLILAGYWLWMGIVYHWMFFSSVNPAARIFGAAFVLQGLLLVLAGVRHRLAFEFRKDARGIVGIVLMLFGTLIYPLVGRSFGHFFPSSPTFGLPCPTTVFTLGVLLLAVRPPRHIVIIPFLWSLVGFMAAVSFGVKEDMLLPIAGIIGLVWIGFRQRQASNGQSDGKIDAH